MCPLWLIKDQNVPPHSEPSATVSLHMQTGLLKLHCNSNLDITKACTMSCVAYWMRSSECCRVWTDKTQRQRNEVVIKYNSQVSCIIRGQWRWTELDVNILWDNRVGWDSNQRRAFPKIPNSDSIERRMSWFTESKAADRCRRIRTDDWAEAFTTLNTRTA